MLVMPWSQSCTLFISFLVWFFFLISNFCGRVVSKKVLGLIPELFVDLSFRCKGRTTEHSIFEHLYLMFAYWFAGSWRGCVLPHTPVFCWNTSVLLAANLWTGHLWLVYWKSSRKLSEQQILWMFSRDSTAWTNTESELICSQSSKVCIRRVGCKRHHQWTGWTFSFIVAVLVLAHYISLWWFWMI